ncbi:winged helix-turn-helix domain-containing protein [Streptomyces sp. NBC_00654]|uniref:AfsR/SARP family transcriptional regulator n=1 Tax=Streptomyces sp. NBC_00654 TaxID=2975799 RepID=UPI002257D062|nr:BTAD domain-containing putative transcriptional regulator [Streptomyces sp. NBC_00654]MCX4968965.1 winged helix-turn-helix domain-containing protein [Streptomyces sp. NBC_00654]
MRYCILGTTQALRDDGTAVALGGARLRALLTVLALSPGRAVPAGVLVDEVWDGDPPADAVGALQALVGRLRRALGRAAVGSVDGGYRLTAAPDAVDLHRFERLAGEGARALEQGDAAGAAALLDEALALWRGPALADLPDRAAAASRWEARRLDARRTGFAAALALGRAEAALPDLAALCEDHPLDEPLQALRIRALRDAGRTAQALAAYEKVRTVLADRLGTDPGPGLRALYGELLHRTGAGAPLAHPVPEGRPAPQLPPAPVPSDVAPQPLSGSAGPAGNLRARLTSFVGRESDIASLREDLTRTRLITLLGPGGAGKTRLSQEVAEAAAAAWPDGVWMAELAPVDDPDTVAEAVLTALGARETVLRGAGAEELRAAERGAGDPLVRLTEHCSRRRMLLLLDNCEHVVEAAAVLADHLLAHCPQLTVLATSREPLGVPGEFVRPVDPLPDPMALRLLADRGSAASPGFRTDADEETAAACAEICHRLDGLPLAIELAAARLRMLTPRQIADRLDDRFRLLTNGSRTVLPRQQTLRAVVDWSWDLLDSAERAVLRRLSVFAGGCALDAAEEVCAHPAVRGHGTAGTAATAGTGTTGGAGATAGTEGADGVGAADGTAGTGATAGTDAAAPADETPVDSRDVAALLGSLVDKSLVVAAPGGDGAMRYRLLETVGEYASERLDEAGERTAVERRHLVHYRELARIAGPELRGAGQRAAIDRLQREYENLRSVLRRAVATRDEHEALCLVLSLAWYWLMRDLRAEARHWADAAAALGPDPFAPPGTPVPALLRSATDLPPPMEPEQLQEARRGVGLIQLACMDHAEDLWMRDDNLERLRVIASTYRTGLPQTCRTPGSLWVYAVMLSGEVDQLREVMDGTVLACREFGYVWELAAALQTRANFLANHPASVDRARQDADESLEIFVRLGDAWGAAEALSSRGEAHERAGDFVRAAEDFCSAVGYAEQLGAQSQVALLRARYAAVLSETGRNEEAEAILREVIEEGQHSGSEATPAARMHLGLLLGEAGRISEAREQLDLLSAEFSSETVEIFGGFVLGVVAWLDNLEGDHSTALKRALQALERSRDRLSRMVAPQMTSVHLVAVAWALGGAGGERGARDAARVLGLQAALLPEGQVSRAMERRNLARAESIARAALGDAAYERAYAEGGDLTLEEVTALAEAYR